MSEALHGHVAELQGKIIFIDTRKGNPSGRESQVYAMVTILVPFSG